MLNVFDVYFTLSGPAFHSYVKGLGGRGRIPPPHHLWKGQSGTKFIGHFDIKPTLYIRRANNCKGKSLPLKIWLCRPTKIGSWLPGI